MSYRNKTYVAFASEDIRYYRLMEAWRDNDHIGFDFSDAHDLVTALDTSLPATIRRRLRERLNNTKQVVLLGSDHARRKGGDGQSFLSYEIETAIELKLPVVVANLDGDRSIDRKFIPQPFLNTNYYTLSVSFQPKIIMHALDGYAPSFGSSGKSGPHYYQEPVYSRLGL
ncbi:MULTISPECIES: TIR domain-containing protein [unclassified Pseudarthrobacter]|uniref:TIR domain-containing protein n=1 Tax=unclassified Pseudarthrobacter TaxID=2647000 RepID=UPI003638799C